MKTFMPLSMLVVALAVPVIADAEPDRVDSGSGSTCPVHGHPGRSVFPYPHRSPPPSEASALADLSPTAALNRARGWVEIGRFEVALRELVDVSPGPRSRLYRMLALVGLDRWREASTTLAAGDGAFPPGCGPVVERARGRVASGLGRGSVSDRAFDRLAAGSPALGAYVDLWRLEAAAGAGDVARGEAAWARIAEEDLPDPALGDARTWMARLYERAGRWSEAAGWYRGLARRSRGARRARWLLDAARVTEAAGDRRAADALRREAIETDPTVGAPVVLDPGTRARLGIEPLEVARTLLDGGRAAEAEPFVEAVLASAASDGTRSRAILLRARIRAARGDRNGAERDYASFASRWPGDPRTPEALYERARLALSSGDGATARTRFENFAARFPSHDHADAALYLVADSYQDDRELDAAFSDRAIETFDRLVRARPSSFFADRSYMRAAHLAFALGRYADAERRYAGYRGGPSAREARYWRARAKAQRGDRDGARAIWRSLAGGDDYYAILSRARLAGRAHDFSPGARPGVPEPPRGSAGVLLAHPAGRTAAALLSLGERRYAEAELARAVARLGRRDAATWAAPLAAWGFPHLTLRIGVDQGVDRWTYPIGFVAAIDAEARAHGADPWWLLAILRQESRFDATALSPVGALGLMQVMPATGHEIADAIGWTGFEVDGLLDPPVALHFGAQYLAWQLERFEGFWPAALAAYNGGPPAVTRWWDFPERRLDPELWIDRMPYRETRNYVKTIVAQRARYLALHASSGVPAWR